MSHQYIIRTGEWLFNGHFFMNAYSGNGAGKNNPYMTYVKDVGPLPTGEYIIGDPYKHDDLGPVCFNLEPGPLNQMFNRKDFRLHADSVSHPGDASHGCIVSLPTGKASGRDCREGISLPVKGGDRRLSVVAEREDAQWIGLPPA